MAMNLFLDIILTHPNGDREGKEEWEHTSEEQEQIKNALSDVVKTLKEINWELVDKLYTDYEMRLRFVKFSEDSEDVKGNSAKVNQQI